MGDVYIIYTFLNLFSGIQRERERREVWEIVYNKTVLFKLVMKYPSIENCN